MSSNNESTPLPAPRNTTLPLGGEASVYTRDNLTKVYACDHAELGRLLRDKITPLPIRVDGNVLWFADEISESIPNVQRVLDRQRRRRNAR